MEQKTNAMRRLDAAKIPYIAHSLGSDEPMSATELAHKLNKEEGRVFSWSPRASRVLTTSSSFPRTPSSI